MNRKTTIGFRIPRSPGSWPLAAVLCFGALTGFSETTNSTVAPLTTTSLPDAGLSLFRVLGALALVMAIFLGGVWSFRNWRRLSIQRGHVPKLNLVETRSLGGRTAIYVVGYERERFLIAASPAGVGLLAHLPTAPEEECLAQQRSGLTVPFSEALAEVLKRK